MPPFDEFSNNGSQHERCGLVSCSSLLNAAFDAIRLKPWTRFGFSRLYQSAIAFQPCVWFYPIAATTEGLSGELKSAFLVHLTPPALALT